MIGFFFCCFWISEYLLLKQKFNKLTTISIINITYVLLYSFLSLLSLNILAIYDIIFYIFDIIISNYEFSHLWKTNKINNLYWLIIHHTLSIILILYGTYSHSNMGISMVLISILIIPNKLSYIYYDLNHNLQQKYKNYEQRLLLIELVSLTIRATIFMIYSGYLYENMLLLDKFCIGLLNIIQIKIWFGTFKLCNTQLCIKRITLSNISTINRYKSGADIKKLLQNA